ncbi:GNAT family N-acetyltransferase [bacterium]|nr:GNAT family N-acetyltransferase [bacterium]
MLTGGAPGEEAARTFVVRRARADDAPDIARQSMEMALETEHRRLDPDTVLSGTRGVFNDERRGFYIVAVEGARIVGQLMVTFEWSDWRNGLFWWIQSVYVDREFRRRGVYRALWQHTREEAARAGGVAGVRLYVERDNAIARRAYEALGMSELPYRIYEIGSARA